MSEIDQGGCAFPLHGIDGVSDHGMSLRDWFAGMALQGMLAQGYSRGLAENAYSYADEMIAHRRSPQETAND